MPDCTFTLRSLTPADWPAVRAIYEEGIASGDATFEQTAPAWEAWDASHLSACRLVAEQNGQVVGWAALSRVSDRCVYGGVAEVSVYVAAAVRGKGVGRALLQALVQQSEREGLWTLQAGIFPENLASVGLHRSCGFCEVGRREKLGRLRGKWRDVLLLERRSGSERVDASQPPPRDVPMFLSAAAIAAMEGVRKVHFLNPNAVRLNKSLGDAVGLRSIGVHLIQVEPGHRSVELHAHHVEEECIYVLSGRATAVLGEQSVRIGPGDFIGCPTNGVAHQLINDGDQPLVCLVMGQRLAQDVTDYPRLSKRLYRYGGRWDVADLGALEHPQR